MQATARLRRLRPVRQLAPLFSNKTAFLTGGTVRDALLGWPGKELDVAIAGDAAACAQELARSLRGTAFPLGREPLITYRVVAGPLQVDLWSVSGSLEEDILRRDFTVNALFFRLPSGPLLDLAGGLDDLAAGRLEVIRRENLFDDPLRVLRGLRLSLTRPLSLTRTASELLRQAAAGLSRVARERIREEVAKILEQAPLAAAWQRGSRLGIWQALGVVGDGQTPDPEPVLQRLEQLWNRRGKWGEAAREVRWLALAAARLVAGEPPEHAVPAALVPLGVTGRELARLSRIAVLAEQLLAEPEPRAVLACLPPQRALLAWSFARHPQAPWPRVARLWAWWVAFSRKPPLLSSQEAVELLGLPPGPQRGEVIARLRKLQALGKLRSPAAARRFLKASLNAG